ncbi:MAG: glyoxalase [Gemmatimonadetes bacterium]|nr:glyoxalase [Gemmatimonadota bacterium]
MTSSADGTRVTALRQVALTVADVEKSVAFYRDAVGLPFLFAAPPSLAFFDIGGVRLMIAPPEGDFKPGRGTVLYLKVADIDAAHEAMSARGVSFPKPPAFLAAMPDHDLWLAEFRDPDGNPLALMCEKPR